MVGGLQGEFGDLDIKYLKQNISKNFGRKYREASGEFLSRARGLPCIIAPGRRTGRCVLDQR